MEFYVCRDEIDENIDENDLDVIIFVYFVYLLVFMR